MLLPVAVLLLAVTVFGQSQAPAQASAPAPATSTPNVRGYAVLLASSDPAQVGFALMKSPENQLMLIPLTALTDALKKGFRAYTAGDFDDAIGALVSQIKQVSAQYDTCRANFNSLASQVSRPAYQPVAPAPTTNDAVAKYLLLRSLLNGRQASAVNLNVTNCNQFPALCVGR